MGHIIWEDEHGKQYRGDYSIAGYNMEVAEYRLEQTFSEEQKEKWIKFLRAYEEYNEEQENLSERGW